MKHRKFVNSKIWINIKWVFINNTFNIRQSHPTKAILCFVIDLLVANSFTLNLVGVKSVH